MSLAQYINARVLNLRACREQCWGKSKAAAEKHADAAYAYQEGYQDGLAMGFGVAIDELTHVKAEEALQMSDEELCRAVAREGEQ